MPLLEENSEPVVEVDVSALEPSPVHRQRRQMLIALALLLAALMLVLVKDRNFWFPPEVPASTTSQVNEPAESVEGDLIHPELVDAAGQGAFVEQTDHDVFTVDGRKH